MIKNLLIFIFVVLFLMGCGPTPTKVNPNYVLSIDPDSVFYDKRTSLFWKMPTAILPNTNRYAVYRVRTLDGSKKVCNNMTIGGFDDWRLPKIEELITLIDYSKNSKFVKNYNGAKQTIIIDEYKDLQILYSYKGMEDFISSTKNSKGETLTLSYLYGTIKKKTFKYTSPNDYSGWLICTRGELNKDYIKNINSTK